MRSINEAVAALRALEQTLIETEREITDNEREALICAVLKAVIQSNGAPQSERNTDPVTEEYFKGRLGFGAAAPRSASRDERRRDADTL